MSMNLKLFLLMTFTMLAFAGNSLLGRLGLASGLIGPASFYTIRMLSAALILAVIVLVQQKKLVLKGNFLPALALSGYAVLFTYAYIELPAGLGALVLFGMVQITMFLGAVLMGENPHVLKWVGMAIGCVGLAMFAQIGVATLSAVSIAMMAASGVCWAVFSLLGKTRGAPVETMTTSFLISVPIALIIYIWSGENFIEAERAGLVYAVLSGAVTSGLGYVLWYHLLPQIKSSTAAIAQLSVPVIAICLGALMLGETMSGNQIIAATIILFGISIASLVKS